MYCGGEKENCSTFNCEIVGLGNSSRNRAVYFTFKQQQYKFYNYRPNKGFAKTNEEICSDFYVELNACEGLLNTYVRKKLVLREKTQN